MKLGAWPAILNFFDVFTFTNVLHLTKVTNSNIFSLFEFLITEIIGTVGLYFYLFQKCMLFKC